MELKIPQEQTGHLMTDLGISPDRCVELCTIIETSLMKLHNDNTSSDSVSLAQVVQKALVEAKTDNEVVFISITAGEYHQQYLEHLRGMAMPDITRAFGKVRKKSSMVM
jgi:hypothetical protein